MHPFGAYRKGAPFFYIFKKGQPNHDENEKSKTWLILVLHRAYSTEYSYNADKPENFLSIFGLLEKEFSSFQVFKIR